MARTDDDSWQITESVGQTALGVALSRAHESASEHPLFTDPYAQLFIDAAAGADWQPPTSGVERIRSISGYAASRTKWFDEFFIAAGANGIDQAVILGAGLDTRAWRLPWVRSSVLYEIDQPKVLDFKIQTLAQYEIQPSVPRYFAVPVDLRQDWPKALRDAGFDATQPTAWSAEGLLPYLPAEAQDLLFERIHELSASGSRVAVESFGTGALDREYLAKRQEQMRRLREEADEEPDADVPDTADLWYLEERTDIAEWLAEHNWKARMVESIELMTRYGRWTPDQPEATAPRTVFIEGHLVGC
ncbi:MAG: class I SAM-dependent methyltransferase [Mycobacterium sp.]